MTSNQWSCSQGATSSLSTSHPLWILGHEYSTLGQSSPSGGEPELDEEVIVQQAVSCACCGVHVSDHAVHRVDIIPETAAHCDVTCALSGLGAGAGGFRFPSLDDLSARLPARRCAPAQPLLPSNG